MKLWIARDKDGLLRLFGQEPYYVNDKIGWEPILGSIWLNEDVFPEITFDNSPQEVELKLCNDNTLDILKKNCLK